MYKEISGKEQATSMVETNNLIEFNKNTFGENEESEFSDKEILCVDCDKMFTWTAGEQVFFRDKGLKNPPKRCKSCKQAKNERLASITAAQAAGIKQRIEVAVFCARCRSHTTVPFYPSQGRPVYCRSCFLEMNPSLLNGDSPEE